MCKTKNSETNEKKVKNAFCGTRNIREEEEEHQERKRKKGNMKKTKEKGVLHLFHTMYYHRTIES